MIPDASQYSICSVVLLKNQAHFDWRTSFLTFIDAQLKNEEMEGSSSKKSSYVLKFPS